MAYSCWKHAGLRVGHRLGFAPVSRSCPVAPKERMAAKSRSFWSRPVAPVVLGAAACAACCVVPIAGIVLGAGVASTLGLLFEPLAGVLLAVAVCLAGVLTVRHWRAARSQPCRSSGACSVDRSCGCEPTFDSKARDVGCSLAASELPGRGVALRKLFARARSREVQLDRAVWTFSWSPEIEKQVRDLSEAESKCCSFMTFDIERRGMELRWTATAPPERRAALEMFEQLATEVAVGSSRA